MRTIAVTLTLVICGHLQLVSQNIPNAGFDSIYIGGIDRVYHWITSDAYWLQNDTVQPFTPNTHYPPLSGMHHFLVNTVLVNYMDTDATHAMNSLALHSRPNLKYPDGTKFTAFICNGDEFYSDSAGMIDFPRGGSPFPYRPSAIRGWYKFEDSLAQVRDYGKVEALLKRWNAAAGKSDTIGVASSTTELSATNTWTPFSLPFVYFNQQMPDSIVVLISSSSLSQAPTTLFIDDISFEFIPSSLSDEEASKPEFTVFPNPAAHSIKLLPAAYSGSILEILDLQGRVLITIRDPEVSIDVSGLPVGLYLMRIRDGRKLNHARFIKSTQGRIE